jgi:hypothetical protein
MSDYKKLMMRSKSVLAMELEALQQQVLIDDEAVSQFITAFYKAGGAPVTKKQVRAGLRAAQEKDNAQG